MYQEKKSYMDAVILNWNQYYLTECPEAARAGRLREGTLLLLLNV
jgi:hypothetical protein